MLILRYVILTSLLTLSPLGHTQSTTGDSRTDSLNKLLNTSSGAQQVLKSRDPEVSKLHAMAKDQYTQAQQAQKQGNDEQAKILFDQSAKTMFSAIRLATPKALGNNKLKADFDKRKESVNTLNTAFDRIADESKGCDCKEKTNQQITQLISNADQLLAQDEPVSARTELDKAYNILKVSIESLRGGQTLVRSLDFATPEEEYHYEIDRNQTHQMLVKLLLDGKTSSAYTQGVVNKFTTEAEQLREKAERSAEKNQFEEAIKLLEESTKQLVRAIRSSGIYIPG